MRGLDDHNMLRFTEPALWVDVLQATEILVQVLSDAERVHDFGHADLFTANSAESLAWKPILEWLVGHRENRTYPFDKAR